MKGILKYTRLILISCFLLISHVAHAGSNSSTSNAIALALPVVAGVYTFSIDDVEGFQELTISCLVTAQLVTLLKYSVQRRRPSGDSTVSFPSGHAAAAFVGASYMQNRYGLAWGLPMYAVACVVSIQRVNVDAHYWTDIIAGAAIGWGVAKYFTICYPNIKVEPQIDIERRSVGVGLYTNFG